MHHVLPTSFCIPASMTLDLFAGRMYYQAAWLQAGTFGRLRGQTTQSIENVHSRNAEEL
jgi:hypothetical protein